MLNYNKDFFLLTQFTKAPLFGIIGFPWLSKAYTLPFPLIGGSLFDLNSFSYMLYIFAKTLF